MKRNVINMLAIGASVLFLISCSRGTERNAITTQTVPDSVYMAAGNRITALTFDSLRNTLLREIQSGGFEHAVDFCSEEAIVLTGAYADSVGIRRVAQRFRNPLNAPDSGANAVMDEWSRMLSAGENLQPKLIRKPSVGEVRFYKPIMTQALCMNCHGTPGKHIPTGTLAKIRQKYPGDQAVDFKEGDLRGAWEVVFNEVK